MKKGVKNTWVHWLTQARLRAHMQTPFYQHDTVYHKDTKPYNPYQQFPKEKEVFFKKKSFRMQVKFA